MIADIGRGIVSQVSPNGESYAFFNAEILNKTKIVYKDVFDEEKYTLTFSSIETTNKYRALHYARYYANGIIDQTPRIVPYIKDEDKNDVSPLYETIEPSMGNLPGRPGFNLLFWTNLASKANTLEKDQNDCYQYDESKILKFQNDKLEEVDLDSYAIKLLCSAQIIWTQLKTVGGGVSDSKTLFVPVVNKILILMVRTGNIAIDFSGGGGGGGVGRHNHADNNNGGFAYAVFAPGTSLQPISWK